MGCHEVNKIYLKIMAETFPNLGRYQHPYTGSSRTSARSTQRTQSKTHYKTRVLKVKNKENTEQQHPASQIRENCKAMFSDFSTETLQARRD